MNQVDAGSIAAATTRVRERIAGAGGDPSSIRLVAVTKGQPPAVLRAAVNAGLADFGESYPQELTAKADALGADDHGGLRWHFIGRLQRNKVRQLAAAVHLWHSVDRLSLAAEVARRAPAASVLVQVNVSDAPQQGGCRPEQAAAMLEGCTDLGLDVRGLMTIGALGPPDVVRSGFRTLRQLADQLGLGELSMGMSGDLESAVAEGATMIRVGTALFGTRGGASAVGK